jgi:hypothetical protein
MPFRVVLKDVRSDLRVVLIGGNDDPMFKRLAASPRFTAEDIDLLFRAYQSAVVLIELKLVVDPEIEKALSRALIRELTAARSRMIDLCSDRLARLGVERLEALLSHAKRSFD